MSIKKGVNVRILRPESYWFNKVGVVANIDKSKVRYPVMVRFESYNYIGVNSTNFSEKELKLVTKGGESA